MARIAKKLLFALTVCGICYTSGIKADEHSEYGAHDKCSYADCKCCQLPMCTGWHNVRCNFGAGDCAAHSGNNCAYAPSPTN